jgi:ABC-type multidrug transport system fused ATPase/permease subunit
MTCALTSRWRRSSRRAETPIEPPLFLRFTSYIRPQSRQIGLGLILSLIGTAGKLSIPWLAKILADHIFNNEPIKFSVLLLALVMLVTAALDFVQSVVLGTAAEKIVCKSRIDVVNVLLRAPVEYLTKRSLGEFITRATSDTKLLREATSISLVGIVNAGVMCIGIVALMYVLDPALLIVTVSALFVTGVIVGLVIPMVTRAEYRVQRSLGHYGGALESALAAIRTVKAAQAEAHQAKSIGSSARSTQRHSLVSVKLNAFSRAVELCGYHVATIVVLGVGAWRLNQDTLDVPTLGAFVLYMMALGEPIFELGEHLPRIQSGLAAIRRMDELLVIPAEDSESAVASGEPRALEGAPLIELKSVSFRHQDTARPVLCDLSFVIPHHGHYAIIGESGVGKSTLLGLMMAFTRPDSGIICMDGDPYANLAVRDVRNAISYVEQDCPLVAGSIRDNLLLGDVTASDDAISVVLEQLGLNGLISSCQSGLDTVVSESTVSVGQRQRLAIARGILRPSRVLLLDEPTAHLDAEAEKAVVDCIAGISRSRAVLTVSHRESTVASADVIFMMKAGKLMVFRTKGDMAFSTVNQLASSPEGGLVPTQL